MNPNTSGASAPTPHDRYAVTRFASASPAQQRLEMLDGAARAARGVSTALDRDSLEDAHRLSSICRELLMELILTLRTAGVPELSKVLIQLYVYMHGLMVHAVVHRQRSAADQVARLLERESQAWRDRLLESGSPRAERRQPKRTDAVA